MDFETDSVEYSILENACKKVTHLSGMSCELGVRRGGSSVMMMMNVFKNANAVRPHIAIDPYGNIEYQDWETKVGRYDYTNAMKNETLARLYTWAATNEYPFEFFCLEDTEFFKRYADGVPIYNYSKTIMNEYSVVFFDGPHTVDLVRAEIDFFAPRTQVGGTWVFDDLVQYPHMEKLDQYIQNLGFEHLEKGMNKISYVRVSKF